MALLDGIMSMFGGSGLLPPFIPNAQAQGGDPQPQPAGPGMLDRLGAGFGSFINSPNPISGLFNGISGLASGQRTDPTGIQQNAVRSMINHLVASKQITPVQAQFLAANPGAWGELSKAMINQQPTVGPDGSLIVMGPFGQPRLVGGFPVSDRMEVTNPDGSKSPGFAVKPSLSNPQGSIAVPGGPQPQAPVGPPPQGQGPIGQRPNPNFPNGGRGIITEAAPGLTREREEQGKILAEDYNTIAKGARTASQTKNVLNVMDRLNPNVYAGKAAPLLQYITSVASTFGIAPDKLRGKASAGELFNALSSELTLQATGGSLGAQISDSDRSFMTQRFPELSQTVEGRRAIINYLKQLADRQIQVQELADQYVANNGGSMRGFNNWLEKWKERPENVLFKDAFSDRFVGVNVTPPAGPGDPGVNVVGVRRVQK